MTIVDAGCRLHVKGWLAGENGPAPDGSYNFYDVSLAELKKLRNKYDTLKIVSFGKWEDESFLSERNKAEAILNG